MRNPLVVLLLLLGPVAWAVPRTGGHRYGGAEVWRGGAWARGRAQVWFGDAGADEHPGIRGDAEAQRGRMGAGEVHKYGWGTWQWVGTEGCTVQDWADGHSVAHRAAGAVGGGDAVWDTAGTSGQAGAGSTSLLHPNQGHR